MNNNVKKGGLYFLIALSVFGYFLYKQTRSINTLDIQDDNPSLCQSNTNVVTSTTNDGKDIYLVIQKDGSTKEVTPRLVLESGYVLGEGDDGNNCRDVQNSFDDATGCEWTSSAKADFKDGDRKGNLVSKSAKIELIKVVAPLVLFSGKDTIKDSNRSLTMEDPVYKPAGEIFTDKDVYVNAPPGTLQNKAKTQIVDGSKKGVFGAEYTVSLATDTSKGENGEAVISKKIVNKCESCNNESNINPEKSNNSALFLNSKNKFPGQSENEEKVSNKGIEIEGECENIDTITVSPKDGVLCQNILKTFFATITSVFSALKWDECNAEDSDGCISTEDIVIKMSPLFKESNEYLETRNKMVKSPEEAGEYNSKYILTDCSVRIGGIGGPISKVKCAWDMAYLFHERELAEYDDTGESNTPSEEEFETFLTREVKTREYTLVDM
jgi:hypothetical protein